MTGALDTLVGDSISGGTGLLTGNTGDLIVYAGSILIVGIIVAALFYFVGFARRARG